MSASDDAVPRSVRADDLPTERHAFFDYNPVLALHDGPWEYRRSPLAGTIVSVAAIGLGALILGGLTVALVLSDQGPDGNTLLALLAFTALVVAAVYVTGRTLSRGRLRHAPGGGKYSEQPFTRGGTPARAATTHAGLTAGTLTREQLLEINEDDEPCGDLVLGLFDQPREDVAFATVHFVSEDDEILVWPPVPITTELLLELRPRDTGSSPGYDPTHQ